MAGNLEFINSFTSGSVTSFSIDNIFSDDYDVYYFTANTGASDFTNTHINLRLLDSTGTVISATEYDRARLLMLSFAAFQEAKGTNQNFMVQVLYMKSNPSAIGGNTNFYIYNPYDSSSYTFLSGQNSLFDGGVGDGGLGNKFISVHKSAETIRGINLYSGETMNAVEVSVYGVK